MAVEKPLCRCPALRQVHYFSDLCSPRPAAPSEPPAADSPTPGTEACPLCAGVDPVHISPILQAHHAAHVAAAPSPVDTEPPAVIYVLPSGSFLPPEEARAARERGLQAFEKVMGPVVVVTESPAEAVAPWPYGDAVQPDIEDDEPPAEAQQDDERDEQVRRDPVEVIARHLADAYAAGLAARAGAGEQQREQVARWLYDTFGLESAHWETAGQGSRGYFSARADELLALLAPQSDGDPS